MATAADIILGAFQANHVYAPGEQLQEDDLSRGFAILNQMIDSWSNESLSTFAILEQSAPLQVGVSSYTIGPGGVFNMTRPIRVLYGPGAAYLVDNNNNRYPVRVLPRDEWNLIWNLVSITSNLPDTMFYDPQMPLGIINVYPQPNTSNVTLYWDSYLPLDRFVSPSSVVTLPPGYELAIERNLAVFLAPYFPTAEITPSLVDSARTAKANVQRSNTRDTIALYDVPSSSRRPYNIYSDRWQ